ncbi:MAG TPA: SPFH domain-containing protein [Longimicrobiaceae bacterium]
MPYLVIAALVVLVLVATSLVAVSRLIVIAEPNEAVVLTGRRSGYRIVRGGRTFRVPLIERASRIPLRTIPIEVKIDNAFSKGGIPLEVQGIANVKIASDPPQVFNNAVERLLDLDLAEIHRIAKDTLEGNLRGVLATLSPEEVNEDRLKFANELIEEADVDLKRLGLQLDMLKIQNVTDKTGYLESIGRAKNAEILRIAAVAEAESMAQTKEKQAEAEQRAEVARAQAAIEIAEAQNALRVRKAELDQEAVSKEKVAVAEAERARVLAEQRLEEARIELQRRRLQADVVEPAEAELKAAQLRAEADAALIRERGLAQVGVFEALLRQMVGGGDKALQVYLAEKLPDLFQRAADALDEVRIDRMVVVDGGGDGVSRVANQKPAAIVKMIEQVAGSLGVDMEALLQRTGVAAEPTRDAEVAPSEPAPAQAPTTAQRRAADSGRQLEAVVPPQE